MALVSLKEQGFIYEDNFSAGINARWELTPNTPSRATHDGTKLNLKHGPSTLYLFLKELTDKKEFVLDLKNIYNPSTVNDLGGIMVYSTTNDFIALEEYFDAATGTVESYPWIRLTRDYNNYYAYWSNDGVSWNFIGSNTFDQLSPKIGLFVEGSSGDDLGVEFIRAFKSTVISVKNLESGTKVSLVDKTGAVLKTQQCRKQDNKVAFDVSGLPVPFEAKIVFETSAGLMDSGRFFKIYGGDEYAFEVSPELVLIKEDGTEYYLDNGIEEFLGYLKDNSPHEDCRILVRNPLPGKFKSVQIKLGSYYGTNHWQRLIEIAEGVSGTLTWGGTVNYTEIPSGTEKLMWARLKREYDPAIYTTEVYFALNVKASYEPV